jgi:hypothetical protein
MFIGIIWSLAQERRIQDISRPIAAVSILLLILSTVVSSLVFMSGVLCSSLPKHLIMDIIRLDYGLVKYRDSFPSGPAAFFADVTQQTYVAKNAIYILQTLLADGVVVGSKFGRSA